MRRCLAPALLLLAACGDIGPADVVPCAACALEDANNFSYTSELRIGTLTLPEETDATLRWERLTRDLRGDTLDPRAEIAEARLIAFRSLTPDEIAYGLAHDELDQSDVGAYVTCTPTDASCALSDFGMFGNRLDVQQYFTEGYGTWLLALGAEGAAGADELVFLEPRADATNATVVIDDTASRLDVDVDLRSLAPVVVPAYDPGLVLDWSNLTRDGLGDPLDADTIDELWVGRFSEAPVELEKQVFDLEALAEVSWTLDVAGTTVADLALLEGGVPFLGVDRQGTWLVALRCRTCTNPAPRLVTFLETAAP